MASTYNPGETVRNYTIKRLLSSGQNAICFAADAPDGSRVFLKCYKSPSIRVRWYRGFLDYQKELKRRLSSPPCRDFCYRFLETFEHDRTYFQAFEWLDHSQSLQQILDRCASRPDTVTWEQRVLMAKVFLGGVHALHEARIVHADLKPDNIMLVEDKTIRMRYRLKLIDMDFSVLTDRQAPWHGHEGYPGTPGYASPEHLRGEVPQPASDVFTCGLMLYELLADGHSYLFDDLEQYLPAYQDYTVAPPILRGKMMAPARDDEVQRVLHLCIHPDPTKRPTAQQVLEALNGRGAPPPRKATAPSDRKPTPPDRKEVPAAPVGRLLLAAANGEKLSISVRTPVGRRLCARFGEDSRLCAETQFILDRDDKGWIVEAVPGTTNDTLLNGARLEGRARLEHGLVLGVGRASKGIVRLQLLVHLT